MKSRLTIALLALTLAGPVLAQTPAGADLFADRCESCHYPAGGGPGPSLTGVVGRKAASVDGFDYSAALKASTLVWTSANLDQFLTDPAKMVPGTAMPIHVPDAADRAAIIAYLASGK